MGLLGVFLAAVPRVHKVYGYQKVFRYQKLGVALCGCLVVPAERMDGPEEGQEEGRKIKRKREGWTDRWADVRTGRWTKGWINKWVGR